MLYSAVKEATNLKAPQASSESPEWARTTNPEAQAQTPTGARIHWIGRFVDFYHPATLHAAMATGGRKIVIIDARYPEAYAREHVPGAISLFARAIDAASTAQLPRDVEYVVYCWNESCRASTIAAEHLAALGFRVHELHGGLQKWKGEGYPTERG